jgi:porin
LCAHAVLALTGAFGVSTTASAQSVRSDNPVPPGQSYLTGDWGGLRSFLDSHGITFTITDTTDLLANVGGGIKTGSVGLGAFQPQLDLDLQKLAGSLPTRSRPHKGYSCRAGQ